MNTLTERIKASILRRKKALRNPLYTKDERTEIKASIKRLETLLEVKKETSGILKESRKIIQDTKDLV